MHVDLIGWWKVALNGGIELVIQTLICIEPVSNLAKLIRIEDKTSAHLSQQFNNCWLSRYPKPLYCVPDNGGEFTGWEFQSLLEQASIESKPTTSRNPQANAICERMHQTVGNVLRTLLHGQICGDDETVNQIIDDALATTMHTLRTAVSASLNFQSPGTIAFHRDMLMNVPFQADLQAIQQRRQLLINHNLLRTNSRRRNYDYRPGQLAMIKNDEGNKLDEKTYGPYRIVNVFTNGTVELQRTPHVTERVNIRRLLPSRIL